MAEQHKNDFEAAFEIAKDESGNPLTDESGNPVYIHPSLEFRRVVGSSFQRRVDDVDVNGYTRAHPLIDNPTQDDINATDDEIRLVQEEILQAQVPRSPDNQTSIQVCILPT